MTRFMRPLAGGALLAFAGVLAGVPADAHAHLESAVPANGSHIASLPANLVLTLSEPARLTVLTIEQEGGEKRKVATLPTVTARQLSVPLPRLAPGTYHITFRTLSADGHVAPGSSASRWIPPRSEPRGARAHGLTGPHFSMTALDVLSVLLRAGSFVLMFQAAGAALFLAWQGGALPASGASIRRLVRRSALAGMAVVLADGLLAPARMAGELAGLMDRDLLRLAILSAGGAVCLLRLAGLALIAASRRPSLTLAGALLALASFPLTGHTTVAEPRALLAALLAVHVAGVTFWLGSLEPLIRVLRQETAARAGEIVAGFSQRAGWVVAALFVAALGMAVALLPGPAALLTPYGALLLTKLAGFTVLLALASLNRWRLAPGIGRGSARCADVFTRVVRLEQLLIAGVLLATAVMTSWFSPS